MNRIVSVLGALLLTACGNSAGERQAADGGPRDSGNNIQSSEPQPSIPPPETGPDARTPLAEPKRPIDPKSAEAAGQVVQHYGALIEQGRWAEAEELWGHPSTARQFTSDLKRNVREVHLEIGKPGDMEGAAGSIYVTVPVTFYGKDNDGKAFRHQADIVVRRVNDVPGSTAAQRAWHIDGIQGEDTGAN